jgi:hypothetical protein
MSSTIVIILIVIAVLVVGLIAFLIIRRQRYVRALRGRHPKTRSNCSAISRSWGGRPGVRPGSLGALSGHSADAGIRILRPS